MLGAYERGERAISVPRLASAGPVLQRARRPVAAPTGTTIRGGIAEGTGAVDAKLAIDLLQARRSCPAPDVRDAHPLPAMIQVQRQDFNGRVLTIRRDDKRAIAAMLDIPVDQVARASRRSTSCSDRA